jgi:regulator of protease activity HflC (stomatin/prohibitin superfamily)
MRTYSEYLSTMTVKTLREIASDMGIDDIPTSHRKAQVVNRIADEIGSAQSEALEMVETEQTYTVPGTDVVIRGKEADLMIRHEARVRRYNPTMKRRKDNKVILTPKQRRRVQKKMKVDWVRTLGAF